MREERHKTTTSAITSEEVSYGIVGKMRKVFWFQRVSRNVYIIRLMRRVIDGSFSRREEILRNGRSDFGISDYSVV